MLYFHVRVALLKCDFLRVPCTESWTSWAQLKAENLRNPKMVLHVPIAAPKLELLASKPNRAFFLGHPVYIYIFCLLTKLDTIYIYLESGHLNGTFICVFGHNMPDIDMFWKNFFN